MCGILMHAEKSSINKSEVGYNVFSTEELKTSFKEKLPTENKYKYKVLITISHEHLVTRFYFRTSCNSDAHLNEIMNEVCDDICKNFPRNSSMITKKTSLRTVFIVCCLTYSKIQKLSDLLEITRKKRWRC